MDLVKLQRQQLNDLLIVPVNADGDLEAFETRETIIEQWKKQLPTLTPRIKAAHAKYQELLDRFKQTSTMTIDSRFAKVLPPACTSWSSRSQASPH